MSTKSGGLVFGVGLVAIANVGAFWFGKSFKIGVAVFAVSGFLITWLWLRRRKEQLVRDLMEADRETQDTVLAALDANDRREILRRLGREDS